MLPRNETSSRAQRLFKLKRRLTTASSIYYWCSCTAMLLYSETLIAKSLRFKLKKRLTTASSIYYWRACCAMPPVNETSSRARVQFNVALRLTSASSIYYWRCALGRRGGQKSVSFQEVALRKNVIISLT